jgi:hypothetical protein
MKKGSARRLPSTGHGSSPDRASIHAIMKLKNRIKRLEARKRVGTHPKDMIAFFDSVLNGTISDEEFARYLPVLHDVVPDLDQNIAGDRRADPGIGAIPR